ncbi:MAG TPA: hypothetical protein VE621_22975 [Bryobacteraceae bacterium]|jgi:hypothetical protein|nr:hypothetical protein [Bryobacteraceae bacterium]
MWAVVTGCPNIKETYAPPSQRKPIYEDPPLVRKPFLPMNDPDAVVHLSRDIRLEVHGGVWRWTGKQPTLLLGPMTDASGVRMQANVGCPELGFKETGPITIQFRLNGIELGSKRLDKPGNHTIELPVPPKLVHTKVDNELVMLVDKTWKAPDGVEYGFILVSAGLVR